MELPHTKVIHLYCLRSFLYGLNHNIDFSNQHNSKQYQENKESYLHGARLQLGNSGSHRQHILNSPRLTTYFGYHPTGLSGNIPQRIVQSASFCNHPASFSLSFRDRTSTTIKNKMKYPPNPTMMRNDQNVNPTGGTK